MHNSISWQQWAQQICTCLETQQQRIDQLEQTVNQLQQTVNQLQQTVTKLQTDISSVKEQSRIHIDKIEYNFDQLKVEKLDGTLTIGLNPSTLRGIEDFSVNGTPVGSDGFPGFMNESMAEAGPESGPGMPGQPSAASGSAIQQDVSSGIDQYLQQEVQADLRSLEQKYRQPLDDGYRELILDDIRKQLDTRIQHYVNQYRGVGFKEPMEAITTGIMEKTKQDILSALETYIASLPKKEG